MSRMPLPLAASKTIDAVALRDALIRTGAEVRFDRLHRALYSTDASVYQIVPLGVVLPRSDSDIIQIVKICAEFRVPLTARGGGTSQAGPCIAAGIILHSSKYSTNTLQINPPQSSPPRHPA